MQIKLQSWVTLFSVIAQKIRLKLDLIVFFYRMVLNRKSIDLSVGG